MVIIKTNKTKKEEIYLIQSREKSSCRIFLERKISNFVNSKIDLKLIKKILELFSTKKCYSIIFFKNSLECFKAVQILELISIEALRLICLMI